MALLKGDGLTQALRGFPEIRIGAGFRSHQLGQRLGDDVELLLRGLLRAATGVLKQHHQQREDACDSVNGSLPFLEVLLQRQADQPDRDDAGTHEEEWGLADPAVGRLDKSVKQRTAISPHPGLRSLAALHSQKPSAGAVRAAPRVVATGVAVQLIEVTIDRLAGHAEGFCDFSNGVLTFATPALVLIHPPGHQNLPLAQLGFMAAGAAAGPCGFQSLPSALASHSRMPTTHGRGAQQARSAAQQAQRPGPAGAERGAAGQPAGSGCAGAGRPGQPAGSQQAEDQAQQAHNHAHQAQTDAGQIRTNARQLQRA